MTVRIGAAVAALAFIAAACSGDMDSADSPALESGAPATTLAPGSGQNPPVGDEGEQELGSGGIAEPVRQPVATGRDIIFTATVTVEVDDVGSASSEASRIIETFDGFLFGQQSAGGNEPTSVLVFKVPPERFQDALAALGGVGEIRTQSVMADDVTDRIVDLESRIATSVASVERLRTLLEEADAIKTITELENQLLARETALEQLRGSLRTLQNQVGLATITVTITQSAARPGIAVQSSAYLGSDDNGGSCPGDGGIEVLEGETVTYCLEITNVGDTALVEVEVRDVVLGLDLEDFTLVFGDLTAHLEPGQSIVLATPLTLERTLRSQTRVTATPINADGAPIEGRSASNVSSMVLGAADPGGIPGFTEGLERSWEVLINFVKVLILAAGLALPFVWVLILGWFYMRWRKNRLAAKREALHTMPAPRVPVTPSGEEIPETDEDWELEDDV
ncbi:MAG: DUF4349 domain-containing protein [Acidimicrobiia bacterium]|nr:DUF4349 domain-containing protein [Acidimicrobiia bacterium]